MKRAVIGRWGFVLWGMAVGACRCGEEPLVVDAGPDAGLSTPADGGMSQADGGEGKDAGMFLDGGCIFSTGQTVYVDSVSGNDSTASCCGALGSPCQTLTHAIDVIADSRAERVTLYAHNSDDSPGWVAPESWPLQLFLGVTLTAPNIYFNPQPDVDGGNTPSAINVGAFDMADALPVLIQGDPDDEARPIHICVPMDRAALHGTCYDAIEDGFGEVRPRQLVGTEPLQVNNAWLMDWGGDGIYFHDSTLTLGPHSVIIGSHGEFGRSPGSGGMNGIACEGDTSSGVITDVGRHSIQIDGQERDLSVSRCNVTLLHGPRFGPPSDGGGQSCSVVDEVGVAVYEGSVVELGSQAEPAAIECQSDVGLSVGGTYNGNMAAPPVVSYIGSIEHAWCFGVVVIEGSVTMSSSILSYNEGAALMYGDGSLVLSSDGGVSTVACNSPEYAPSYCVTSTAPFYAPSGQVNNTSVHGTIDASNVSWTAWDGDAGRPNVWSCTDLTYKACTCLGPDCASAAGWDRGLPLPNSFDILYLTTNTNAVPVDYAGGSKAPACP